MKRGHRNLRTLNRPSRRTRMSLGSQWQQYRAMVAYCSAYIDAFVKPCFNLRRRRKMAARQRSVMAVVLQRVWKSRLLRVAAVREHLRTLHVYFEQSLFWLHSAKPYGP